MVGRMLVGGLGGAWKWAAGARVAVWIDTSRAPTDAAGLVERAMKTWSDASDGRVTLVRANTRNQAAIRIFFVQNDTNYRAASPPVHPSTPFIARAGAAITPAAPYDPI